MYDKYCGNVHQGFPNWGSRPRKGSLNKLQGSLGVHNFSQSMACYAIAQYAVVLFTLLKLVQLRKHHS